MSDLWAQAPGLFRFFIFFVAVTLSYLLVMGTVFKFEGGLFHPAHVPETVSPAMCRARLFFLKVMLTFLGLTYLTAYGLSFSLSHDQWISYVGPSVLGASLSMLYTVVSRFDRIRPREGK